MEKIIQFAGEYEQWLRFFHLTGVIIALGAVTMSDILLAWFKLKPEMGRTIARISPIISLQVWIGLFLISFSGMLMFMSMSGIENFPVFQFKMFLVLLLFLNGIFLNLWVTPKFEELLPEWNQGSTRVKKFTIIAGVSAAISFLSWWGVIILIKIY